VLTYVPVACPWFYPLDRLADAAGASLPGPLGACWSGECQAAPGGWQPDGDTGRRLCNFGYAREHCPRVPRDGADAIRFSVARDDGGIIGLQWVIEKDHLPFAHGRLEYSRAEGGFHGKHEDARLSRQAEAYVISYLHAKG
jgi:hypothetical protein